MDGSLGDPRFEVLVETPDLRLGSFALGYVSRVDYHGPHSRVVKQIVDGVLEVAPGAVPVLHPELQGWVNARGFQELGEYARRTLPVIGMDGVKCVGPYPLFWLVTRHPFDCRAYVDDSATGIEYRDSIGGVLYQRAVSLLALSEGFLDLLTFGDIANDGEHQAPFGPLQIADRLHGAEDDLDGDLLSILAHRG